VANSPSRSSKRNIGTADQDSVEKAAKLKARKNLEEFTPKGNSEIPSFNLFNDELLVEMSNQIGVNLGNSQDAISQSISMLRQHEILWSKSVIDLGNTLDESGQVVQNCNVTDHDENSVGSIEDNPDIEALNLICEEVAECLGDGGCNPFDLQTPVSLNKNKSVKKKKSKRSGKKVHK
jgi:hypothetical protein